MFHNASEVDEDVFYDSVSDFPADYTSHHSQKNMDNQLEETPPRSRPARRTEIPRCTQQASMRGLLVAIKKILEQLKANMPVSLPITACLTMPISTLQMAAKELKYSALLDEASMFGEDSFAQMARVAAYEVASYSNMYDTSYAPLCCLLNETYELDRRDDFGWRFFGEYTSHAPMCNSFVRRRLDLIELVRK